MKKVIFCAAALMFGAMGFAQTGPAANGATPVSGSPANANLTEVDQLGTDQRVQIEQVGRRNSAKVTQFDKTFGFFGDVYDNNEAYIKQSGPVGFVTGNSYADDNMAEAQQKGKQNETSLIQSGLRNNARSDQGTNGLSTSERNKVRIVQGSGDTAPLQATMSEDNFAYALQEGDRNSALIGQNDDNNEADIDQDGDDNKAQIKQTSFTPFIEADGHIADIEQDGDDNKALIDQNGYGGSNDGAITQEGDDNKAYQTQFNTGGAGAAVNTASIDQLNSYNAKAYQKQLGEGNDASITQTGGEWYPDYDSNYAEQTQIGDNNEASITQNFDGNNGIFPPAEEDNYAKQLQHGDGNEAHIDQDGEGNKAYQKQWGDNNFIDSEQDGHDNKLASYQWGNNNHAITSQDGSDNHGLINQYSGQSADLNQIGHGNSANIFQAGPGGGYNPGVCYFGPQLDIPCPEDVPSIQVQDPCPSGDCY